jgi:hypothetical protein
LSFQTGPAMSKCAHRSFSSTNCTTHIMIWVSVALHWSNVQGDAA